MMKDIDREENSFKEDDTLKNSMIDINIDEAETIIHSVEDINRLVEDKLNNESKLLEKRNIEKLVNKEDIFFIKSPKSFTEKGINSPDLLKEKTFIDLNSKTIPNTSISISIHSISVHMSNTNTDKETSQDNLHLQSDQGVTEKKEFQEKESSNIESSTMEVNKEINMETNKETNKETNEKTDEETKQGVSLTNSLELEKKEEKHQEITKSVLLSPNGKGYKYEVKLLNYNFYMNYI